MVDLSASLTGAIKDQRAILFLGSGASLGAQHPKNKAIPLGDKLRDLICDQFFDGKLKSKPLTAVAAMAANEAGLIQFQKYIHDVFEPFEPADFHYLIPQFRWKAIVTTNFDLIIERAYRGTSGALQNLVKSVKDGDQFDKRISETSNPIGYYKLHGCVEFYTDESIPLILSMEQYASYERNRTRFYQRVRDLGHEHSLIFAGYSINDPHIQNLLFDLTAPDISRPMYYYVSPGIEPVEQRYWAKHRVECVDSTFADFLLTADRVITKTARAIPVGIGGGTLSIRKHYRIADAQESSDLIAYLSTDATHVHAGIAAEPQRPEEFYRGYDRGWGCILQNLDAKRTISDSVLVDAVLVSDDSTKPSELYMLKGPAGNGKSVVLKRIAWEAAVTYDEIVLYVNNSAGLKIEAIEEIYRLTGKRILVFVDHVALIRAELLEFIRGSKARHVPVTIIGAERNNEWNVYCENLEGYVKQEFQVRYLEQSEIEELLGVLERHNALGILKGKNRADRIYAFANSARRQLLVALHEATLGFPFEDIVLDEYRRIEPPTARRLYLDICGLHQFGAPIRAGLISRASGITFEQFGHEFLSPLESVVEVIRDAHTGNMYYCSRHPHVATIVFDRALPTQEEKFDLLADLAAAINIDYSSDRETFSRLIKGRGIVDIFPNVELGRLFYDRIEQSAQSDAFVFHQRAVFEINHASGSLRLAENAARRAFEINPTSRSIQHTQADIARRLANETDDPLRKQALRRSAREKLGGEISRASEYDLYTRARLALDELREQLRSPEILSQDARAASFVEVVKDAELAIQRGLQSFPENPEILTVEASFRELLSQTAAAERALERAFRRNPRLDWLAVRLARKYSESSDWKKSLEVLDECLRDNPGSKTANMEYALILMKSRGQGASILEHLRRSFTDGDNQFDAQFWYGRELFLQGQFATSATLFGRLNERAPGRFRNQATAPAEDQDGKPAAYSGRVERFEEGYSFVRISSFPAAIFASRAESDAEQWKRIRTGSFVTCAVAFNRRGACATNVRLRT